MSFGEIWIILIEPPKNMISGAAIANVPCFTSPEIFLNHFVIKRNEERQRLMIVNIKI